MSVLSCKTVTLPKSVHVIIGALSQLEERAILQPARRRQSAASQRLALKTLRGFIDEECNGICKELPGCVKLAGRGHAPSSVGAL